MRCSIVMLAMLIAAPCALGASNTTTTPTTPIPGTVANKHSGGGFAQCSIDSGLSVFQRGAATRLAPFPIAEIGITRVIREDTSGKKIAASGLAMLKFASATAGMITFDNDDSIAKFPAGESIPFDGYAQVWTPATATLKVSFTIKFSGCNLPVIALYHAVPVPS
jgi:hypothetical protein